MLEGESDWYFFVLLLHYLSITKWESSLQFFKIALSAKRQPDTFSDIDVQEKAFIFWTVIHNVNNRGTYLTNKTTKD